MAKKVKEDLSEIPETVEQTGTVPEKAGLNLSDIRSCVSIIDIVSKRGAFEGVEMSDVGAVRNRLENFLKAADEAQAAKIAEDNPEETAAE